MDALDKLKRKGRKASKDASSDTQSIATKDSKKKRSLLGKKPYAADHGYSLGIQPFMQKYEDESMLDSSANQNAPKTRKSKLEKIQQLQEANSALKKKNSDLKHDIKQLTKQCRDIQRSSTIQLSALELQLSEAQAELSSSKEKAKTFEEPTKQQLDGRLLAIQALKEATQKQENRIARLKGDLERRRYQARAKDDKIRDLEKTIETLKQEKLATRDEYEKNQTELITYQRELTTAIERCQRWERNQQLWEAEKKDMIVQLRDSQTELMKEKSLRSVETIESKGEENNLHSRLVEKIERIAELELELERVKGEVAEEREMSAKNEKKMQSQIEKEVREGYEEKLKEKEATITRLIEEKEHHVKQSESLRLDKEGMNVRITWLMEDSDRLRKKLDEHVTKAADERARHERELAEKGASATLAVEAASSAAEQERSRHAKEMEKRLSAAGDTQKAVAAAVAIEKARHKKELEASTSAAAAAAKAAAIVAAEERAQMRKEMDKKVEEARTLASVNAAEEKAVLQNEMDKKIADANAAAQTAIADANTAKAAAEAATAAANSSVVKSMENKSCQTLSITIVDDDVTKQLESKTTQTIEDSFLKTIPLLKQLENATTQTVPLKTNDAATETDLAHLENVGTQTLSDLTGVTGTQHLAEEQSGTKKDDETADVYTKEAYETLEKELDQLRTWAKAALQNVQRLEDAKAEGRKKNENLKKKLAEMESKLASQGKGLDDASSIGSNTLINFIKGDFDDDITVSSAFDFDDASLASNHSRNRPRSKVRKFFSRKNGNNEQSEFSDKIISVPEEEIMYKEEKIRVLQVAKNRHEKTIGSLVKEVIKLRKTQKDNVLQLENLQHEREAFKMKIAVLEKEFSIMDINTKADSHTEIAAKFQQASRGQSDFVAETTAQLELRAKNEKISALEKLISEDKQVISSIQLEMDALRNESKKSSQEQREEIEKLRRENISFFQQVKQLEREQEEAESEQEDVSESGSDSIEVGSQSHSHQDFKQIKDLTKKVKDRDGKIAALKRYNEMMEKTVAQLRKEYVNLRTTLREDAKQSKEEIEKLIKERDSESLKVSALELQFMEINRIQEEKREIISNKSKESTDTSSEVSEAYETIKILKLQVSNIKSSKNKEIESLEQENEKLSREKGNLEQDIMRYLTQIDEAKLRIDSTAGELKFMKSQLESVEEEKMLMEEDLQGKLDFNEEKVHELEAQVLKLRESNLDQHQAIMKKKKKKKKKTKGVDPKILKKEYNNKDAAAAAEILSKMLIDDGNDNLLGRYEQNTDTESDYTFASESEFETETDNDTEGEEGSMYGRKKVLYDKLLPRASSDEIDEALLPLPMDQRGASRVRRFMDTDLLPASKSYDDDDDDVFDGLPIQPEEIPDDRWL